MLCTPAEESKSNGTPGIKVVQIVEWLETEVDVNETQRVKVRRGFDPISISAVSCCSALQTSAVGTRHESSLVGSLSLGSAKRLP